VTGARCIVTGGTGALGREICLELGRRGARVALTFHRGEEVARELCERIPGASARRLDLTRTADIGPALDELADRLGGVDAFVHAAGIASTVEPPAYDALADLNEPGFDRLMAVNVKSALFACRHLLPLFPAEGGNIVFVGSINGVKPVPAPVPYAASKAALRGAAQALAKELGKRNLRVNVVAPGVLESGASEPLPPDLRAEYLKHSALKRLGRHDELAALIAFMAIDNSYVTGQTLVADGGL
jgi:NAD(P)-dependent dehydrogenase (short-subunit alcohol dehydrogenase family)